MSGWESVGVGVFAFAWACVWDFTGWRRGIREGRADCLNGVPCIDCACSGRAGWCTHRVPRDTTRRPG